MTRAEAIRELAVICLPVRLARATDGSLAIAGEPGSTGDAGWSMIECESRGEIEAVARSYPQARMPCWARMGL
jgi:hypothetical protein